MAALKLTAPFYEVADQIAVDLPGATAVFTTRRGGYSQAPYDSLNLGVLTDDAPEHVRANHQWLQQTFGVQPAYGRQVHGTEVRRASAGTDPRAGLIDADAIATTSHGVAPLVFAADCLPIVIAGGGAVAAVHAGWKGLAGGVIAGGVQAVLSMAAADTTAAGLAAAIGPGAGVCCYEVGEDLHNRFADPTAGAGADCRRGQNLDLKAIARAQLQAAGVTVVHDVGLCTICDQQQLLFSHRREHGVTGRQGALAWLN